MEKSEVHEFTCSDCATAYIDQTGRRLETRACEHEAVFPKKTSENFILLPIYLTPGIYSLAHLVFVFCKLQLKGDD